MKLSHFNVWVAAEAVFGEDGKEMYVNLEDACVIEPYKIFASDPELEPLEALRETIEFIKSLDDTPDGLEHCLEEGPKGQKALERLMDTIQSTVEEKSR